MEAKGIKIIVERADKEITTWHDVFEKPIEDIINGVKFQKKWMGGKILEMYLEFDNKGQYHKVYLDVKDQKYNLLLGS